MQAIRYTLIAAIAGFAVFATSAQARDLGPDQAVRLLEAGKVQSFEKLNQKALAKHPNGTVDETELKEKYGKYIYEVELRDEKGQKWEVDLDAATGEILHEERDD